MVLLRRFTWSGLPTNLTFPGIDLSSGFADNDPDFVITYNTAQNLTAHIEDLYELDGDATAASKIGKKFAAVKAHIDKAIKGATPPGDSGTFWMTFASAGGFQNGIETVNPKVRVSVALWCVDVQLNVCFAQVFAEGDGHTKIGMNAKLSAYLKSLREEATCHYPGEKRSVRVGGILLDFYGSVGSLVQDIISENKC